MTRSLGADSRSLASNPGRPTGRQGAIGIGKFSGEAVANLVWGDDLPAGLLLEDG